MNKVSAQGLRTAVFAAVTQDAAFRDALTADPAKAVQERFGEQPLKLRVYFEKDHELSILLPEKTEKLAEAIARTVGELADRSPNRGEFEAAVINRAWSDPAFLEKLRAEPRAALDEVLQKYGTHVPANATVTFYEELPGECVVVVPRPADTSAELSDAELEAVAGGEGLVIGAIVVEAVVGAVVGAIVETVASKVIDKIFAED